MTQLETILIPLIQNGTISRNQAVAIISSVMFADEYCELSVPNGIDGMTSFTEMYGRISCDTVQELNRN